MREKNDESIIGFDFQGWPIYKMTYREILEELGFERKDGKYQIGDTDGLLDTYPLCLEDDGMGYGVNEKYVVEVNNNGNIFIDRKLSDEELKTLKEMYSSEGANKNKQQLKGWLENIHKWLGNNLIR